MVAYIYNKKDIIYFEYGDNVLRFRVPKSLQRITKVKKWDKGYLVVMVKYSHNKNDIEDYIDIKDIMDELYIDSNKYIKKISSVKIA